MTEIDPVNLTAAADKSIGFDYQFYYFLYLLLDLRHGETIGLEVKDDIHLELADKTLVLIQTKHTTQQKADGSLKNLTERDSDLWKTLYNWANHINSETENRKLLSEQLAFIKNTRFVLLSNKAESTTNQFLSKIAQFKNEQLQFKTFKEYLDKVYTETEDTDGNKTLRLYIDIFRKQKKDWLSAFAKNLEFALDEDDLLERIRKRILEKIHEKNRVEDVFACLEKIIREHNYLTTKSKAPILITFEVFSKMCGSCFKKGLSTKLPIRKGNYSLPENPREQRFIQQLIDIGDIESNDIESILRFTKFKLIMFNNLKQWREDEDLSAEQEKIFIDNCINDWRNRFDASHRKNRKAISAGKSMEEIEEEIKEAGLNCLDELRTLYLKIEEDQLDSDMSNGEFYLLSDEAVIGWHLDWENKYGGEKNAG